MPPKHQFSKEHIIDVAFEIARAEGLDGITIRKVAEKLGSSIAPIYVNFQDVDELNQEVVARAFAVSQHLLSEVDTGNPFYDLGVASLRFASEYSLLFKDLVVKTNKYMKNYDQDMGPVVIEHMKKDPVLAGFTEAELAQILLKLRIFQLGLSIMVANDLLPGDFDEKKAVQILTDTSNDIITAARLAKT
jgi:AcrR family transcriptional regulator